MFLREMKISAAWFMLALCMLCVWRVYEETLLKRECFLQLEMSAFIYQAEEVWGNLLRFPPLLLIATIRSTALGMGSEPYVHALPSLSSSCTKKLASTETSNPPSLFIWDDCYPMSGK